jgi:hypothetical protein
MIIFWRLALAHLLGDFTLQSDTVNTLKRNTWWGMLLHTLTHLLLCVLLTYQYLGMVWLDLGVVQLKGWEVICCVFLLHHAQDEWRIFSIRKFNTADGTIHFFWDQFIHFGVLFAFMPIVGFVHSGTMFPEKWVVIAAMFVLVSHFSTVMIYFVDKDFYGADFPGFDEKYFAMAQRVVLWLFFLIPGWECLPCLLVWLGYIVYLKRKRVIDFSHAGIYVGTLFTMAVGLLSRYIIFRV